MKVESMLCPAKKVFASEHIQQPTLEDVHCRSPTRRCILHSSLRLGWLGNRCLGSGVEDDGLLERGYDAGIIWRTEIHDVIPADCTVVDHDIWSGASILPTWAVYTSRRTPCPKRHRIPLGRCDMPIEKRSSRQWPRSWTSQMDLAPRILTFFTSNLFLPSFPSSLSFLDFGSTGESTSMSAILDE